MRCLSASRHFSTRIGRDSWKRSAVPILFSLTRPNTSLLIAMNSSTSSRNYSSRIERRDLAQLAGKKASRKSCSTISSKVLTSKPFRQEKWSHHSNPISAMRIWTNCSTSSSLSLPCRIHTSPILTRKSFLTIKMRSMASIPNEKILNKTCQ